MNEVNDLYDTAHRDALIYGYGFLVVNRAGAVGHIAPQYIPKILDDIEQRLEEMNDD